jgi:hypothetical protein
LVLGADDCPRSGEGCAGVEFVSSTEAEEAAAALSLALFAVSPASPKNFF